MREEGTLRPVFNGLPGPYTLSTNPPNPKSGFRVGDWRCTVGNCAAHNFGRNLACVGCGRPRVDVPNSMATPSHLFPGSPSPLGPSPRFAVPSGGLQQPPPTMLQHPNLDALPRPLPAHPALMPQMSFVGPRTSGPYPLLTPSGRALSIGGRVQNISHDPLVPCVMYWPDNEPLPEQGQIRPLGSAVLSYPPIINTGNKGAAEKQPGDWICHKCHYLNWRRRKVCQTCFPYAEGNGDSISAAVQAERIALLENVLATQVDRTRRQDGMHPLAVKSGSLPGMESRPRDHSTPPVVTSAFWSFSDHQRPPLGLDTLSTPIYQTADGESRLPSSILHPTARPTTPTTPLLPSFLQDIVQSPSLSPSTSTSSAELSVDEYEVAAVHSQRGLPNYGARPGFDANRPSFPLHGNSIWKLDGEESKTLTTNSSAAHPAAMHQLERRFSQLFATSG